MTTTFKMFGAVLAALILVLLSTVVVTCGVYGSAALVGVIVGEVSLGSGLLVIFGAINIGRFCLAIIERMLS